MSSEVPNTNYLWCSVIAKTLEKCGLEEAVICPGSRSTPLVYGFARESSVEATSVLDERSAAFFALGMARTSGKPVALVCTSGTAVANFLPAVIEASESGTPLLLLTADRPSELRNCSAGQTIDQVKIYGSYVRHFHELPVPENDLSLLRSVRQQIAFAYDQTLGSNPGPVHLNLPFRDPLPPIAEKDFIPVLARSDLASFTKLPAAKLEAASTTLDLEGAFAAKKGIVLIGPCNLASNERATWIENVSAFCTQLNWPVMADALSPVRLSRVSFPGLVGTYDLVCRSSSRPEVPEAVIVIGDMPTSKVLRQWLSEVEPELLIVSKMNRHGDPVAARSKNLYHDFGTGALTLLSERGDGEYKKAWLNIDAAMRDCIDSEQQSISDLEEHRVAWSMCRSLPTNATLCVSNSMVPRDLEFFATPRQSEIEVFSSRGANGIDGILSTALGVAKDRKNTYLLTGDLALLHDSNGGLIGKGAAIDLTVVVVNNDGGGIFEMLPVSNCGPEFETYFGTPQSVDFEKWAELYGFDYCPISDWEQFESEIAKSVAGLRLIEIKTSRKNSASARKKFIEELVVEL
ncbi:2-succinyl-5-enolpyruvyl-6-hydroxy-3-cyclohexene-1-carboxylic-acid synthase [Puniceicoccaceae bacterium K14]|nr:2-succinyl-5-enolpyruvyl-6-hydroxy-3-cyclohexene-1-carboxylic-acid synthase [Puniceicoccaceae bacterium K14]